MKSGHFSHLKQLFLNRSLASKFKIIYIYNLSARDKNKAAFAASILPLLRDNLMTGFLSTINAGTG